MDTKEIINILAEMRQSDKQNTMILNQHTKILERHANILDSQRETLLRNTITVEEHHKRSLFLENEIEQLKDEVEPLKNHIIEQKGVAKFLKLIGIVFASILSGFGIWNILKSFF